VGWEANESFAAVRGRVVGSRDERTRTVRTTSGGVRERLYLYHDFEKAMAKNADTDGPNVAVVGGAVGGLATAERLCEFADVTVFERQSYDKKRVDCGEAINDASVIPLEKTPENGFFNDVEGFDLLIHEGVDHGPDDDPIATSRLRCREGYITDRDVVERRWAERLRERGVEIRTGSAANISPARFESFVDDYDYVVDATGQPSLTMRARGRTDRYTGDMVALNATVEGDFTAYETRPRIFFESYVGYSWSFPKSAKRANVGIGWAGDRRPDDYMAALEAACERNGLPVPERSATNVYTIPRGPSLDPQYAAYPDDGLFLVGDAAGIANRYQGEGICQAVRSAYLLAALIREGKEATYPRHLYEQLRSEYRLARLMRGAWEEHEDPQLLADVAMAVDGATIDEITRSPRTVLGRVLRRPRLTARLLNPGMARRLVRSYTDDWEYGATA
jgi:digeranylgeranylglycerophospholipid reductase